MKTSSIIRKIFNPCAKMELSKDTKTLEKYSLDSVDSWSTTTIEEETFTYRWNIHKFKDILQTFHDGGNLTSFEFIGGQSTAHSWFLQLKITKVEGIEYFSLFLFLKKIGNMNNNKKLLATLQFSILDTNDKPIYRRGEKDKDSHDFLQDPTLGWGYHKFLRKEDLLDKTKGFTQENQLQIHCRVWLKKDVKSYESVKKVQIKTIPRKKTCEDFKKLLGSSLYHDVVITTTTQKFKAHKAILSTRSSVFAAMFQTKMYESINGIIEIPDFEDHIVHEMLNFIYCGEVENMTQNISELIKIADKYDIKDLRDECMQMIPTTLTCENSVEILLTINKCNAAELKSLVFEFIARNKKSVRKTSAFQKLFNDDPELLKELIVAIL